jgi:membrane protein
MNTIWNVPLPPTRGSAATILRLIRDRFYSFVTVLAVGFVLLFSLLLNAWIAATRVSVPPAARFLVLFALTALLFAALYKIVPDIRLMWSDVAPGAILTAALFMFGKQLMGLYLSRVSFGSAYSAAGSPMVVLLWIYYSALLFFWGAEFCKAYTKTMGSQRGRQ